MPDPYIYDAINAFKFSSTGQGRVALGGEPAYVARYSDLAALAIRKLWELYGKDEIKFDKMKALGKSNPEWLPLWTPGYHILINRSERTPEKLGAASSTLVHEAVHLVTKRPYVEEEMLCRTVEVLYYRNLLNGVTITSQQTGRNIRVSVPPNNNMGDLMNMNTHFVRKQLVDYVVSMETYRKSLDAKWIRHSSIWWRGFKNRLPKTKGYYLNVLASEGSKADSGLIIDLLESTSRTEWIQVKTAMKSVGCSLDKLRKALQYAMYSRKNWYRIAAVQKKLGDNLGVKA